ncbi:MAG: MurR/RpiR family transcriptional regulator [Eubacteriales bacterium]|nr:MurR/RpiR family transcriptional regulator [Eubacteriales bacterium]
MKSVLVRMTQYQAQASMAEQGVLGFVLENPQQAAQSSIHQLAQQAFSSPSTVVRLCRKLGFEGYRDMQKSLLYEMAVRRQETGIQTEPIEQDTALSDIVDRVTLRNITSLENSRRLVEEAVLRRSVELICGSATVLLFGIGASFLVAQDAYLKFLRADKPCALSEDIHSQYLHAKNARPEDAAIIISYSGHTEEILRCARELKRRGTPIIAITRFDSSPLSQLADCNLHVVAMEEAFRSGAMSSRISQLNMIDILFTAYISRNYAQSIPCLERNQLKKVK